MRSTVLNRIVELVVGDVVSTIGDDRLTNIDTDHLDSIIQKDLDAVETAVYESMLNKINERLSSSRTSVEKWWE